MRLTILAALVVLTAHANPREIVQDSIAKNEANWAEAPTYSHIERDARHAGDGVETAQTFDVLIIEGSPYNKLIALNDQPLSREQQADEERKLQLESNKRQHEPARARGTRIAKSRRELDQNRAMLKAMAEAFDYRLQGDQEVDGHDTWVLEAIAKPGYRPRNRDTRILAGMKGTLWIDKASDQWVRVEAEVTAPVSLLGVLAKVEPGTRFVLEQEPVSATLWLPKHFSVKVKATVLGMRMSRVYAAPRQKPVRNTGHLREQFRTRGFGGRTSMRAQARHSGGPYAARLRPRKMVWRGPPFFKRARTRATSTVNAP